MKFNSETSMKDIALSNPAARKVLEEAGLDYCCGGSNSLHEACLRANASEEEILNRLQEDTEAADPDDVNGVNWMAAPMWKLTRNIREKHHRYVREAIPRTQARLERVGAKHGNNHRELLEIHRIFNEIGREMLMHMQKEEQLLFPYIEAVELAANAHGSLEPPFFQTVKNPVYMMMKEHDAAGELVKQIRDLSGQYTAPADACTSYRALYEELKGFETDLHLHVHLENNILFPRAVKAESTVH